MTLDEIINPPVNPGTPDTDAVWFDTGPGGYLSFSGLVGDVMFDEEVTVFVEVMMKGASAWIVANNDGDGDVVAADTLTEVRVGFTGWRTRVRLRTGSTPPSGSGWHANGRVTQRVVG